MSGISEHGVSIGVNWVDDFVLIKMKAVGTLNHSDYELIVPMLENALKRIDDPKISLLLDATQFNGWSLEAAWDDLKFGLKHNRDFEKIALVGSKTWQEYSIKIANMFSLGSMEYFEDIDSAMAWLSEEKNYDTQEVNLHDMTQKEVLSRKEAIENQLELLFKTNMKITDWDVPEADDKKAADMIIKILQDKLNDIKNDVEKGTYDNY